MQHFWCRWQRLLAHALLMLRQAIELPASVREQAPQDSISMGANGAKFDGRDFSERSLVSGWTHQAVTRH
jgi:hypothetical protein